MGCELGKLATSKGNDDKGRSTEINPPPPPPSDPRLPLTAKQKFNMMASWKGISRAMEPTGIFMFLKLFEENKELLSLFEKFESLKTRDEQANSMELAEHANTVMNTLDEAIKGLDNLDVFFQYLHATGQSHQRIPGFRAEYFWRIEQPFLEAVKRTLGDRYTDNVDNIYRITIKFIIEELVKGFEGVANEAPAIASEMDS